MRGRSIAIQFGSPALETAVRSAIAHMKTVRPASVDVALSVIQVPSGYVVMWDLAPISWCRRLDQVTPLVKAAFWQAAFAKRDYFLEIHAGVVSNGERFLLLPAAPGSGKTTLTAGLIARGFRYFSDEVALLELPALELRPVPLSLTVKAGAIATLSPHYPGIAKLPIHLREDDEHVRYLPPPLKSLPADLEKRQPVGWIVFPRYRPGAQTTLRPISRSAAMRQLMEECLSIPDSLSTADVARLVQWLRGVECFEMETGSLDVAVDQIRRLCQ